MSPGHRLRWLALIAVEEGTAGTARVAIYIAEQARDGRLLKPTGADDIRALQGLPAEVPHG